MRKLIKECKDFKIGSKCKDCWQNVGDKNVVCLKILEKHCTNYQNNIK